MAKKAGEGGKFSSLLLWNLGTAKYVARSQWCSLCGPHVELACPHLSIVSCLLSLQAKPPVHAEKEQGQRSLWLQREALRRPEEWPWTAPCHLQKDKAQLLNGWSKPHHMHLRETHQQGYPGISPPTSGDSIRSLSGAHQYGERGLAMGRLHLYSSLTAQAVLRNWATPPTNSKTTNDPSLFMLNQFQDGFWSRDINSCVGIHQQKQAWK